MALTNCLECNQQVSDTASFCPHCGFDNSEQAEINKSPLTFWSRTLADIYFSWLAVLTGFDFIGFDNEFFEFKIEVSDFSFYPWLYVPLAIGVLSRSVLGGMGYAALILIGASTIAGTKYIGI